MKLVRCTIDKSPVKLSDISNSKFEKLESIYDNMINISNNRKVDSSRSNNVLGKITGIFCMKNSNSANGRFYSNKFWREVINSQTVQNRFRNSTMIGTLEHPISGGYNDEHSGHLLGGIVTAFHPIYGGFVTKNVEFDEQGYGIGEAYLLDTMVGNIILSYMISKDDNGENLFNLYPSSRGYSTTTNVVNGIDVMDPNDYDLVGWDLVFSPGVSKVMDTELKLTLNEKLESMKNKEVMKNIIEKFESVVNKDTRKTDKYINKQIIKKIIK